jgi:Uma2 family endonuclease
VNLMRTGEVELTVRRWRRVEYDRLIDLGMFEGERLELLDGLLVVREPQRSYHASITQHVARIVEAAFGPGWLARHQLPLALDDDSEPEPDVAMVPGAPLDYFHAHPSNAALIVEVADSSLRFDRRFKTGLYARAGIADYWIVNLVDNMVEVHRDPAPSAHAEFGAVYRQIERLRPPAVITPLEAPAARIPVADLLPLPR